MDRREFIRLGGGALGLPALLGAAACGSQMSPAGRRRPNVLFICTDQFNAACAGFAGHPLVRTPNLDRLAEAGTVFTNCYSNSPVCVPARAAMFTGIYPHEVGAYDNAAPFDGRFPAWTNRLTASGYRCRATGKLDFCSQRDYGMLEVLTQHGHDTKPDITAYFRNPIVPRVDTRAQIEAFIDEKPSLDLKFVAEARRFLGEDAPGLHAPWVQYVGLNRPHPTWVVPERFYRLYPLEDVSLPELREGWPPRLHPELAANLYYNCFDIPFPPEQIRRARAAYYASISLLDEWVGQLLDALEKSGQAGNTVVIFSSDHGEMLGDHGMWFKSCPYDPAALVPLIISGPGFDRRTVKAPVSHVDLAATLLELGGLEAFPGLRGKSLASLAAGGENGDNRWAYSELNNEGNATGVFWVRKGPWKYVHFVGFDPLLFNLEADPGENDNLAGREEFRAVEDDLEGLVRSVVDPEKVSAAAFDDQQHRLDLLLPRLNEPEIYGWFSSRLGDEFAAKLRAGRG